MSNDRTFTSDQAAAANTALRMVLGLPPEQFAVPQFVAMISDEIEQLRKAGQSCSFELVKAADDGQLE